MERMAGSEAAGPARAGMTRERLQLRVVGLVQGVGFRPFVHRLAGELALAGWIRNDDDGVTIEVEGDAAALPAFVDRLSADRPPASLLYAVDRRFVPVENASSFKILPSASTGSPRAWILPDLATCPACRDDVLDPANRRHRYPFTNCTHCGPRFTIVEGLPYDRARTTMRAFPMCEACAAEYGDAKDRRFHAQPNACAVCGPRLSFRTAGAAEAEAEGDDALREAAAVVRAGRILALKGLGGYHLVVDARSGSAVAELRRRKRRPFKPLAVMMPDEVTLRRHVEVPPYAESLLASSQAPIVLLPRRAGAAAGTGAGVAAGDAGAAQAGGVEPADVIAPSVAPGSPSLGVFLPYTPLHLLLLAELGFPVVATSGNASDQPTIHREDVAARELAVVADAFLDHDRPIARQADDSVFQVLLRPRPRPQALRRARGYAPLPVLAPRELPPIVALGGQKNAVFAISRGREVILSQHLGDLEEWDVRAAYRRTLDEFTRLFGVAPRIVAHDLHPDYFTTSLAEELAREGGLRAVAVQHHHAHLAACLLESGAAGRALGVTWDGTGFGTDRTVWGGEFLLGDARGSERVATLHPFRLPGGEAAVRETWRTALALLEEAYEGDAPSGLPPAVAAAAAGEAAAETVRRMIARGVNAPVTTSVGRLCDGVAALLGISMENTHQAQSPQLLEAAAWRHGPDAPPLPLPLADGDPLRLDWRPAVRAMVDGMRAGVPATRLAASFHHALVEGAVAVARRIGEPAVALTGGVFCNRYLGEALLTRLEAEGHTALSHSLLPPTDGSLAAGQLWAAAQE